MDREGTRPGTKMETTDSRFKGFNLGQFMSFFQKEPIKCCYGLFTGSLIWGNFLFLCFLFKDHPAENLAEDDF